jgi:hypothetical protein
MRNFLFRAFSVHCCEAKPAIFVRNHNNGFVILLLFVDDILLTGTDQGIDAFVKECCREFKTRDLGTPKLFLGIQIERNKNKIVIHQRNYIRRLLERFNVPETTVATPWTPSSHSSKLPKWSD